MTISRKIEERFVARLDDLIQIGKALPMENHKDFVSTNRYTGETKYNYYQLAKWGEFVEWRTSCVVVLDQVVPVKSLLRATVNSLDSLSNSTDNLEFAISFLKSVRTGLEHGDFADTILQIEAEILEDYLAQASSILFGFANQPTHIAAAVLIGASLEKFLKTKCKELDPQEPTVNDKGIPLGLNQIIDLLKKRRLISENEAKHLRAWAGIRNSAAHGDFDQFDRHQVENMLEGVNMFILKHS